MRKWIPIVLGFFFIFASAAFGGEFPLTATYHFFDSSQPIGFCKISAKEKDGKILINSRTLVEGEDYRIDMNAETEADPVTFRTHRFTYDGTVDRRPVSGKFHLQEDSIYGYSETDGNGFSYEKKLDSSGVFPLQEFLMEHQILLARAYLSGEKYLMKCNVFFPSHTTATPASITIESEREIPVGDKAVVCKKLVINVQSSSAIASFVDPKVNLPIYILFPATQIEAFLESHYGEHPTPFYRKLEPSAEPPKE
ncbi:MAG: hypothetical protein GTO42_02590 [Candidatus Latescibacteria bacterium]|nr:hypothetical protein [Candidatus Latescibacterota bacterium]NIO01025.1 hypothetical protein [Candidatus Latescibacterota bacterium]NIO27424.1 hypothetical protein [Candidatus Latescibacterota bacterium]NIO54946.1 hypothetical protein [Candidatus Latescibacterota bacterium]NIT01035.1 hypothetical protein [Candidatus Latescibacterota bacterium]